MKYKRKKETTPNGYGKGIELYYSILIQALCCKLHDSSRNIYIAMNNGQGPVSRKPWKHFGPVKPFFVHLNVKTEKCTRLKLLV